MAQGTRSRATVKWFNEEKGYGFLKPEHGGPDVFVHFSGIDAPKGQQRLSDGEEVEYEVTEGRKGPQASKVRRVN